MIHVVVFCMLVLHVFALSLVCCCYRYFVWTPSFLGVVARVEFTCCLYYTNFLPNLHVNLDSWSQNVGAIGSALQVVQVLVE